MPTLLGQVIAFGLLIGIICLIIAIPFWVRAMLRNARTVNLRARLDVYRHLGEVGLLKEEQLQSKYQEIMKHLEEG